MKQTKRNLVEYSLQPSNLQPSTIRGRIFQINASDGGVPKLPLRQAEVSVRGLQGDRQRNLQVHGGPDRALCLYSLECILALQAEGHPIYPGSAGENVTVYGLEWSQVAPGMLLRLGSEVLLEITRYTDPCKNISPSFREEYSGRISQKLHPGWSRVYGRVLQTGQIRVGDKVEVVLREP
jgi:MOSC domain-containing protein YiiM